MIVFQVPVSEIKSALERKIQNLELEFDILEAEKHRREEERKSKGIPALEQKYKEVLKEWESLPDRTKKRTMKPEYDLTFDRIVIYREEPFSEQIFSMLSFFPQKEKPTSLFIVEIIKIEDLYEYEHKNGGGRIFEIEEEISAIHRKIRNIDSDIDFHEELTIDDMKALVLDVNDFHAVRHRTRLGVQY